MLSGQVAIVTGASRRRGIGRATALKLAGMGARVVPIGRRRGDADDDWHGAESVAAEIAADGGAARARHCDITRPEEVEALVDGVVADFGRLDILVNNAGASDTADLRAIAELDDAVWDHGMEANVKGAYLAIKYAMRPMIAQRSGAIVNVSSLAGRQGMPNYGAYCAAKFGLVGLTQQAAQEGGRHNVRVNCICPGATDTDMLQATLAESAERKGVGVAAVRDSVARGIALRRIGDPSELAAAIAFLAGPEASFITGQTLNVCGGQRMD
jgi:3-oxoacyl-[acyl-carrier protein] reductase/meso-butanediol dehydrogenase/(S,S)-butanediol dehydrogenase/diacetyl reductase